MLPAPEKWVLGFRVPLQNKGSGPRDPFRKTTKFPHNFKISHTSSTTGLGGLPLECMLSFVEAGGQDRENSEDPGDGLWLSAVVKSMHSRAKQHESKSQLCYLPAV